MDARNTNRFTMLLAVQQFLDNHSATWSTIPVITNLKNDLDALLTEIRAQLTASEQQSAGITQNKSQLRDVLATKAARYSGALQAYAQINDLPDLKANAQMTRSDVILTRDADLGEKLQGLVNLLDTHKANLADYGIMEAQITEFATTIDDFRGLVGQPRQRRSAAQIANRRAEENTQEAVDLLNNKMDKVMLMFSESDADFYTRYTASRVIVDN